MERVDVFGRHIKAKRVDGSYRAMESADKVGVSQLLNILMMCSHLAGPERK